MKIISTNSTDISSRGLRRHLMDGLNHYYHSADGNIFRNDKTELLTVIKR